MADRQNFMEPNEAAIERRNALTKRWATYFAFKKAEAAYRAACDHYNAVRLCPEDAAN